MLNETLESDRAYQKDVYSAYRRGYEQGKKDAQQHWIPVTERLPEERYYDDSNYVEQSDSVLVFTRYKTYYISRYWGHRTTKGESNYVIPDWMDLDEYISDAVVAWMPLPKLYEIEGDAE